MAHSLTIADEEFDYRLGNDLDVSGLYEVRRRTGHADGQPVRVVVAHVMFSRDCPYSSVAMQALVAAMNAAAEPPRPAPPVVVDLMAALEDSVAAAKAARAARTTTPTTAQEATP